jgi:hypothetical protein
VGRTGAGDVPRLSFDNPYTSRRAPVFARKVVATSHPLAAQAGLMALPGRVRAHFGVNFITEPGSWLTVQYTLVASTARR